jgi:hypothetical protein
MSFERFSTSDVYIFEHVGGFIECCGCSFADWDTDPFPNFKTPYEALRHLDAHEKAGDDIGNADKRIINQYPDLHVEIQPYVKTPEQEARQQEFFRKISAKNSHPPKRFRDTSNGE